MDGFFPIIIIVVISIISSIIKSAKKSQEQKTIFFDKNGKPIAQPEKKGGLGELIKELKKISENANPQSMTNQTKERTQQKVQQQRQQKSSKPKTNVSTQELVSNEPLSHKTSSSVNFDEQFKDEIVKEEENFMHKSSIQSQYNANGNVKSKSNFISNFMQKDNLIRAVVMKEILDKKY